MISFYTKQQFRNIYHIWQNPFKFQITLNILKDLHKYKIVIYLILWINFLKEGHIRIDELHWKIFYAFPESFDSCQLNAISFSLLLTDVINWRVHLLVFRIIKRISRANQMKRMGSPVTIRIWIQFRVLKRNSLIYFVPFRIARFANEILLH